MKGKIKRISIVLLPIIVLIIGLVIYKPFNKNVNINKVLKTKEYSYLPKSARNYIENVYKETGEVVLTEKNKKENTPYLNPQYVEYLELSDEEKRTTGLIPDTYVVDYEASKVYGDSQLPASYNLGNINGNNYLTPQKNQGSTSICWAFTSIENAETLIMKQKGESYNDNSLKFSVRQMDYATATDHLIKSADWISCSGSGCEYYVWNNPDNGCRQLDGAGNFFVSSIAMSNAITLTDESTLPWTETKNAKWPKEILGYDKVKYETDSTIILPQITNDTGTTNEISSYVRDIKNYMMQYGGAFVGTLSPQSTCGFKNENGDPVLKTDDCYNNSSNSNQGHAMQIIGWNDNYEYKYCDTGTKNTAVNSNGQCSSGTLKEGKGAWILRNSWGDSYKNVYLAYDSTRLSVGFITSISSMNNRSWDNNYHSNPWLNGNVSNGMSATTSQEKEFETNNTKPEKIEKIKIFTASTNGKYNISIISEGRTYNNIATLTSNEVGIHTINLSNKNVIVDNNFKVKVEATNGAYFYNDSISVFTSNVDKEPLSVTKLSLNAKTYSETETIPSNTNPVYVSGGNYAADINVETYTKNIPVGTVLEYKVTLDGKDYTNTFLESYHKYNYINNYVYLSYAPRTNDDFVCGKTFTFEVLYNGNIVESFPIKRICRKTNSNDIYPTSTIRFHRNDGTDYYSESKVSSPVNHQVMTSDGLAGIEIENSKEFFKPDKYIVSWNTKPDGTGTTYRDNEFLLYADMDLYAQWSKTSIHEYLVNAKCPYTTCGSIQSKTYTAAFNKEFTLPTNTFTNENADKKFIGWSLTGDEDDDIYYEEETAVNLTAHPTTFGKSPYNRDETTYLYAIWSDSASTVTFDPNGGTGSMRSINAINNKFTRLKKNSFTKANSVFIGWNTKADGSGNFYQDQEKISTNSDITLYAQWSKTSGIITFNANNGTDQIKIQNYSMASIPNLELNTFTKTDYSFVEWNTKADGTGNKYANGAKIVDIIVNEQTEDVVLYAQWKQTSFHITGIELNETEINLTVGENPTKKLVATITPDYTTDSKVIAWTSNNTRVAQVSTTGKVTAISKGNATITAITANGLTATCKVNVKGKTGWFVENGDTYYYDDEVMQKGIIEISGSRYLLGITSGKLYKNGLATITSGDQAGTYLTDENGKVKTGFQEYQGDTYYFNEEGVMQKGITEVNGSRYLLGITSGKLYRNGLATITSGETAGTYITDSNGKVKTGFQSIGSDTYYFDNKGVMQKGITEINGSRYLLGITSGKLYKNGLATITSGETAGTYLTDGNGKVKTGFQNYQGDTYYFDNKGVMQKGITEVDGSRYLLGITSGKLYKNGLATITSGETAGTYITDENGKVKTGFQSIGSDTYYFNEKGVMQKGITEVEGSRYLLGITSGKLYKNGLATITSGETAGTYITDENGKVQTGWIDYNGEKYYADESGKLLNGVQIIEGKARLFGVTSYKLYKNGLATTPDKKTYYADAEGVLQKGKITINGKEYNFGNDYALIK